MCLTTLYRVRVQTTGSYQGYGAHTYYQNEIVYCGTDRDEARIQRTIEAAKDYGGSPGNPMRTTYLERSR